MPTSPKSIAGIFFRLNFPKLFGAPARIFDRYFDFEEIFGEKLLKFNPKINFFSVLKIFFRARFSSFAQGFLSSAKFPVFFKFKFEKACRVFHRFIHRLMPKFSTGGENLARRISPKLKVFSA